MKTFLHYFTATLAALFLLSGSMRANEIHWTGGGGVDTSWGNAANWGGTLPTDTDTPVIDGVAQLLTGSEEVYGLFLGQQASSEASLTIGGGATLITNNSIMVGEQGRGTLLLEDNATLRSTGGDSLWIANGLNASSTGSVILKGSSLCEGFEFYLPHNTNAAISYLNSTLIITDNATMNSTGAFLRNGSITVSGSATWNVDGSFEVDSGYRTSDLFLSITVSDNGKLTSTQDLYIDRIKTVQFTLGFSATRDPNEAFITASGLDILEDNSGRILNLTGLDNLLSMENIDLGVTLTLFDLSRDTVLEFEKLQVDGADILTSDGSGRYEFTHGELQLVLEYNSGSDGHDITLYTIAQVPEPATWAMLAGGLGVLALLRRRK